MFRKAVRYMLGVLSKTPQQIDDIVRKLLQIFEGARIR